MKALILNSGMGSRMAAITDNKPKCMSELFPSCTILDMQLQNLIQCNISEVVITTGPFEDLLKNHIKAYENQVKITYVHNTLYRNTNYIYSIFLANQFIRNHDILLLHGDLVFTAKLLKRVINSKTSAMVTDRTLFLPEKDFKAVVSDNRIVKIGIEFFKHAYAAQPLYKWFAQDMELWLDEISAFCENGSTDVYAEQAFNHISNRVALLPLDAEGELCMEVDTAEDLENVKQQLHKE